MTEIYEAIRHTVRIWAYSGIIPESFEYAFVINAVICALFTGPVLGAVGTMVVTKRLAFFSQAIGQAALTGVAIGILLGEPYTSPYASLFGFCILFGLFMNYTKNRTKMSSDTLIGVFLSISLAVGACLLLYVTGKVNMHVLDNILFGSILTVNNTDMNVLVVISIICICLGVPFYNRMLLASFNRNLALVRGVRVRFLDYLFILMITVLTVASVKIIGAVLVEALLLIPAAAARNISRSIKAFFIWSIVFSTVGCLSGIIIPMEFEIPVPSGGAIIIVTAVFFFATAFIRGAGSKFKTLIVAAAFFTLFSVPPCSASEAADSPLVLTGLQSTFSAARAVTENTPIRVAYVFSPKTKMSDQKYYLKKNAEKAKALFSAADCVITIRSIWHGDPLFPNARKANIRVVEIDAATPVDPLLNGVSLISVPGDRNKISPFIWMSLSNQSKMTDIISADLKRLYPDCAARIDENLKKYKRALFNMKSDAETALLSCESLEACALTDDFAYLTGNLNIDVADYFLKEEYEWTEKDLRHFEKKLKAYEIKTVIHKWEPNPPIRRAINAAGASLAVLDNADPGLKHLESLDPRGYMKIMEKNLSVLTNALTNKPTTPKQ